MRVFLSVATLTLASSLWAQTAEAPSPMRGVRHKAQLDEIVQGLRQGRLTGPQSLFEKEGGDYRVYTSYIDNRKGAADIHATDDEIFVVLSGEAECTLGGEIADKSEPRPNEFRGTKVTGGVTRKVGVGDIVSAPRGTAHQMNPGSGHILYVVIKILGR